MAVGDKIYLADKQTLDEAKSNTETIKTSLASTNSKLDLMDTKVSTKAEQSTVNTIDANVKTANTNINTLNTKVGVNNDAGGTTTVFARLKQIYDYLAGTILTAINNRQANWGATTTHRDRIDTTISSRASQATVNTINSNINAIKGFTDKGTIKSIQRGQTVVAISSSDDPDTTIESVISRVNPSKSFINFTSYNIITGTSWRHFSIISTLEPTKIVFKKGPRTDSFDFVIAWEVIEFY